MPLDFVQLAKSHTSEYLADTIHVVVKKFQIQNKICGIVTDNASNNSAMVLAIKNSNGPNSKVINNGFVAMLTFSILRLSASGQDGKSLSDNSEGEDAEEQICRFDNNATHSSDDNDPVQPYNLEPELTLDDIHDLSERMKIMIFTPL
ncbi:hypothetical protein Pst134EA_001118 [Puccinia striiformis f. sp. tritici]|uniref:hypothetical protein n=1 Tax=Puccinia striiformis f. sp. tritici TaxID=168172 RepID=UPI00200723A7|nr:hypothetical protein Pst134EA_001118 [Puccinia striiformis f. sp. tritici]KAH9474067.1 hypothetical protein Pst134EA_001118 [Puccinia striiformis f. sp. tritici]